MPTTKWPTTRELRLGSFPGDELGCVWSVLSVAVVEIGATADVKLGRLDIEMVLAELIVRISW